MPQYNSLNVGPVLCEDHWVFKKEITKTRYMAKVFQILVPDNTLVSRIISCENQVTELFVIDRADTKYVPEHSYDLNIYL